MRMHTVHHSAVFLHQACSRQFSLLLPSAWFAFRRQQLLIDKLLPHTDEKSARTVDGRIKVSEIDYYDSRVGKHS